MYYIAINGPSCALSRIPWNEPPIVSPTPQQLIGFPTVEEAEEMQAACLHDAIPAVEKKLLDLVPRVEAGEVQILTNPHPEPPTTGQTIWTNRL